MREPRNSTSPRVIGSTPVTRLNVVLLPAPFGPISPMISPALTVKSMSLTATSPPNSLRIARTSRITSPGVGRARCGSGSASRTSRTSSDFAGCAVPRSSASGSTRARPRPKSPVTIGHSPVGARCSSSTSSTPNTMISKFPFVPISLGNQSCNWSRATTTTPAPSSAPHTCAAPPTTVMNRYSMPALTPNGVGLIERCRCAYSQPEIDASSAA